MGLRPPSSARCAVSASFDRVAEHQIALHPQMPGGPGRADAAIDVKQVAILPSLFRSVQGMPRSAEVPAASVASSTTAPAPSPNSTQVPRSVQSMIRLKVSAPDDRMRSARPARIIASALASA